MYRRDSRRNSLQHRRHEWTNEGALWHQGRKGRILSGSTTLGGVKDSSPKLLCLGKDPVKFSLVLTTIYRIRKPLDHPNQPLCKVPRKQDRQDEQLVWRTEKDGLMTMEGLTFIYSDLSPLPSNYALALYVARGIATDFRKMCSRTEELKKQRAEVGKFVFINLVSRLVLNLHIWTWI